MVSRGKDLLNSKVYALMGEHIMHLNPQEHKVFSSVVPLNERLWAALGEDRCISMTNSKYTYYPRFNWPVPFVQIRARNL